MPSEDFLRQALERTDLSPEDRMWCVKEMAVRERQERVIQKKELANQQQLLRNQELEIRLKYKVVAKTEKPKQEKPPQVAADDATVSIPTGKPLSNFLEGLSASK